VLDDAELTQDLSGILGVRAGAEETTEPRPSGPSGDHDPEHHGDFRSPMFVPASPASPRSPASPYEPFVRPDTADQGPIEHTPPRTVLDAPPPGVLPRTEGSRGLMNERVSAERDRRRRGRRRGLIALILVLMLTAAAALGGWYLTEGRFTTAPALEMMSQAEAQTVADKSGLSVQFDQAYSETTPVGLVATTDPGPGAKVRDGGQLVAYLSKGPERHQMPTLAGSTLPAATSALDAASLSVGKVTETHSESVAKGRVISAQYKPGTSLKPDTAVDLVVSTGPKPIAITDFAGKKTADAEKALEKVGFKVTVEEKNSDEVDKGLVISQDPSNGTGKKGDEITLISSKGPVMVTVPNVRRMGTRAAESVMTRAGFKVRSRAVKTNYLGLGYVVYTDPRARSQAPKGSTITLYVV
jgi:serine/threonine-protein kinase